MSELPLSAAADPFARDVYTVSRLNLDARALLEDAFSTVWIEGEISNLARPRSGHIYFTLKDEHCQVRCAMFRMHNRSLSFTPEDGMQVLAHARVSLYPERGEFQLIVQYMEEAGAGALRRAFDALKSRLGAEGLFDTEHKRPLPVLPRCVGVVTSPTGAAVRDVLSVLGRRFPAVPVVIHPVPVQGAGAAEAIARMIDIACERAECDVLILARGGGSLEDLWAFNEEAVARAMYRASMPVVTGVGHEVDFTIADLVADLRAPTPSAAAESVVPDANEWAARYRGFEDRLVAAMRRGLAARSGEVRMLSKRLVHPRRRLVRSLPAARRDDDASLASRERRGARASGDALHPRRPPGATRAGPDCPGASCRLRDAPTPSAACDARRVRQAPVASQRAGTGTRCVRTPGDARTRLFHPVPRRRTARGARSGRGAAGESACTPGSRGGHSISTSPPSNRTDRRYPVTAPSVANSSGTVPADRCSRAASCTVRRKPRAEYRGMVAGTASDFPARRRGRFPDRGQAFVAYRPAGLHASRRTRTIVAPKAASRIHTGTGGNAYNHCMSTPSPAPFDTHRFVKRMTEAGMPLAQAEALAEEQGVMVNTHFATKQDFGKLRHGLADVRHRLGNVENRVANVERDVGGLKQDVGDLKTGLAVVRAELGMVKWMVSGVGAGMLLLLVRTFWPV